METSGKILVFGGGVLAVVVAAVVSVLLARQPIATTLLTSPQAAAAVMQQQDALPVLVARRLIRRGTTLRASDVAHLFAVAYEPKGVVATQPIFSSPQFLAALLRVVPRQTTATIVPGQQLSASLLSGLALPSAGGTLAARLPTGYDAETVSIPVADRAVGNAIGVNDHVDVIYSRPQGSSGGGSGALETAMFIQGVTVVATDPLSHTYTLALTPQDTVRLAHAKAAGWILHLALRSVFDGSQDRTVHVVAGASVSP